jgi:hypothetical protein
MWLALTGRVFLPECQKESMMATVEQKDEHGHEKPKKVTVSVNGTDVAVLQKVTGEQLKQAAIAAGVPIQADFILYKKDGTNYEPILDDKQITVHKAEQFRCVASDDVA